VRPVINLFRGKPEEKCPLCESFYLPEYKNTVCTVCEVAQDGKGCIGLRISPLQFI
jgi:coatomer protein complex subunit alpha (xenin)